MLNRSLIVLAMIGLATPSIAEEGRRQLGAHSHGEGKLAIAIEGKKLEMELEVPGSDILGFEHEPRTAAQKKALSAAKARLAKLQGLYDLTPEAACKLGSARVDVLGAAAGEPHDHDHDHKTEKDTAKGAKADDHDHAHEHGSHSEFRVTYTIECANPEKLGAINFGYFKAFKGAQKLDVTVIGPKGQSSYVVTRDKPVLDLSGVS